MPLFWALIVLTLALAGQWAMVTVNYGQNPTALFRIGAQRPLPPELANDTWFFPAESDYDGQFFRLLAHDPLGTRGYPAFMDAPAIRYSRILLPAAAFLLAGGWQPWIDAAYIGTVAAFLFLGTFFTGRWAVSHGRHPAWGLGFLLLPGSFLSVWMMTGEIALLAISAVLIECLEKKNRVGAFLCLALAGLCRETGLVLPASAGLICLLNKDIRGCLVAAASLIPTGVWYGYIHFFLPGTSSVIPAWLATEPATGFLRALFIPPQFSDSDPVAFFVWILDRLSLAGLLILFVLAARRLWKGDRSFATIVAGMHIGIALAVNNTVFWQIPLGYTRPFSTMMAFVGWQSFTSGYSPAERIVAVGSILAVSARIWAQWLYGEWWKAIPV